jgi:pSer/pThr/pTyr-binding forkhead associated (FHA) protein
VVLEDEGSLNGTFVNGERVEQRLLEEGDRLQVGPHLLVFVPRQ